MTDKQLWISILVMAFVTAAIRFLPFLLFNEKRKTPKIIEKLGRLLPYAIMGMLVVYCLKDIQLVFVSSWLPAVLACFVVGILYIWKRNTLLSILLGTAAYMFLVQIVF